jgi:tetratricopeptide (TPR) repeat protein
MAPVIVATSVFEESDKPLVHEMGVSAVISKPSDRPKILNEIIYTIQQDRSPTDVDSLERKIRQSLVGKDFETAGTYRNQVRDDQSIPKARKLKIEAEFFLAENKYTEARDAGVAALKMSSDSIMLLSLLGKCFLRLGDYAASLKCFERAQMLSPMNIGRLCEIASAQSEIGKNTEAKEALDKAKSQDPTSPEVAEASAKVALNTGDVSEARSIMEKMESLADIISYMNNRAVAHSKSGKPQEGVTLYKKTFDSIPQDRADVKAIVKYNLALALVKQNSLLDAQSAINDALALGATKVEKKAISLRERIGKSIRDGVDFKLKTNDILPSAEIGSPNELLVKEENSASIEAVEKKAGDLGCYKIVKDTMPHELIDKMLQKKQPRFMPRESIKRAETLGVDKAS